MAESRKNVEPSFLKRNGGWLVLWVVLVLLFGALWQVVATSVR